MQEIDGLRPKLKEKLEWGPLATFVPNKDQPIYNWFYYKEGFASELVFNLLEQFRLKPGDTVLDPFCGSGTTLLACKEKGIDCIGFDTLPVSVFASRVKTQNYNIGEIRQISKEILAEKFKYMKPEMPKSYKRFFTKPTLEDIEFFRKKLDMIVANDITASDAGFGVDTNRVTLITPHDEETLPLLSKEEVAARVVAWVAEQLVEQG